MARIAGSSSRRRTTSPMSSGARSIGTVCVATILVAAAPVHTQSPTVRVSTYALDVTFHPERAAMEAQAHITFQPSAAPPDSLTFYLHGELAVDSVLWEGAAVPVVQEKVYYYFDYSLIATRATVARGGRSLSEGLSVFYQGYLNPSRARSNSDYMRVDTDGVLLRGYAYSVWFPIFLDAWQSSYRVSFPRVTIRTPPSLRTVFVGTQLAEREENGHRVSEWRATDVDLLEVQCSAQPWEVTSRGAYHAYHQRTDLSRRAAARLLEVGEQLAVRFRRYFRSDAVAPDVYFMEMPPFGDISSGNVVGLTSTGWAEFAQMDPANNAVTGKIATIAHELVHAFVRPQMDFADPLWAFMIEGFPSYFFKPVLAELLGEEYYRADMRRLQEIYLRNRENARAGRRGLPPEKPLLEITADEVPQYKDRFLLGDRGGLFFNYLRTRMGSERFLEFAHDLFSTDTLDVERLEEAILTYLPDAREDVRLWLTTSEYPERFRLETLWP
ncbi:MAG: hypothetical protein GTN78_00580 [Gemmatimonadales bacterium]|nr:hypothetical protein [Gemmatimonadales bacterium]NIN10034.1 hypothetical protein [Gemmatimonadales bacterium]NIQ98687.1 hypothetical protein [Gemmatimonadales bacterium]NIS63563.1 hypothetical protein [Gemmatimonadales bacterium]